MSKNTTTSPAAKAPPFTPTFDEARQKWRLSVPARLSPTGKQQRLFFDSKRAAELEQLRLAGAAKRFGTESVRLSAHQSEEAARAFDLLAPTGATLTEAVCAFVENWQTRQSSIKLSEAWKQYYIDRYDLLSEAYQKDLDRAQAVIDILGDKLLSELAHQDILSALESVSNSLARQYINVRTISPLWKWAIKESKPWATLENPCIVARAKIHEKTKKLKKDAGKKAIDYLLPSEVIKLLGQCKDHRKNKRLPDNYRVDCTAGLAAFVLLVFTGLRPDTEIRFLHWDDIDLKDSELETPVQAKTGSRTVSLSANCVAWLNTIPAEHRQGLVVPSNWKRIFHAVKHQTGVINRDQRLFRHTFATYHRKAHSNWDHLAEQMGNSVGVLRRHYVNKAAKDKHAVEFWNILPRGATTAIRVVKSA